MLAIKVQYLRVSPFFGPVRAPRHKTTGILVKSWLLKTSKSFLRFWGGVPKVYSRKIPTFIGTHILHGWCQIGPGAKLTPLHSWCQIGTGAKLTLLHSWCQIDLLTLLVPNWLRCQIDSGAKLSSNPGKLLKLGKDIILEKTLTRTEPRSQPGT